MDTEPLKLNVNSQAARADLAKFERALDSAATAWEKMEEALAKGATKTDASLKKSMGSLEKFAQVTSQISRIRINATGASGINALAASMNALSRVKAIDDTKLKSLQAFARIASGVKANPNIRGLERFAAAMSNIKTPTAAQTARLSAFFRAMDSYKAPRSAGAMAALFTAIAQIKVPTQAQITRLRELFNVLASARAIPAAGGIAAQLMQVAVAAQRAGAATATLPRSLQQLNAGANQSAAGVNKLKGALLGLGGGGRLGVGYQLSTLFTTFISAATLGEFVRNVLDATNKLLSLQKALMFVTGSQKEADAGVGRFNKTVYDLGLNLKEVQGPYARFLISAREAGVSLRESEGIFRNVAMTLRTVGATTEQTTQTFYALQEMLAKGKVQSKEFTRQLAQYIPGAAAFGAQALSDMRGHTVSIAQFYAAMKKGAIESGPFVERLSRILKTQFSPLQEMMKQRPDYAMNRMATAAQFFFQAVGQSSMKSFVGELTTLTDMISPNGKLTPQFQHLADAIGKGLGDAFHVAGEGMKFLTDHMGELLAAARALLVLKIGQTMIGWGGAANGVAAGAMTRMAAGFRGPQVNAAVGTTAGIIAARQAGGGFGMRMGVGGGGAGRFGALGTAMRGVGTAAGELTNMLGGLPGILLLTVTAFSLVKDQASGIKSAMGNVVTYNDIVSTFFSTLKHSLFDFMDGIGKKSDDTKKAGTGLGDVLIGVETVFMTFVKYLQMVAGLIVAANVLVGTGIVGVAMAIKDAATLNFKGAKREVDLMGARMGATVTVIGDYMKDHNAIDVPKTFNDLKEGAKKEVDNKAISTATVEANRKAIEDAGTAQEATIRENKRQEENRRAQEQIDGMNNITKMGEMTAGGGFAEVMKDLKEAAGSGTEAMTEAATASKKLAEANVKAANATDKTKFAPGTVPSEFVEAIIKQESSGRAGIAGVPTKYGTAHGLMQMLDTTGEDTAKKHGLTWSADLMSGTSKEASAYQRALGEYHLRDLSKLDGGDPRKIAEDYFAGHGTALHGKLTTKYGDEVMAKYDATGGVAGKDAFPDAPLKASSKVMTDEELEKWDAKLKTNVDAYSTLVKSASPQQGAASDYMKFVEGAKALRDFQEEFVQAGGKAFIDPAVMEAENEKQLKKLADANDPMGKENKTDRKRFDIEQMKANGLGDEATWQEKLNALDEKGYKTAEMDLTVQKQTFMLMQQKERSLKLQLDLQKAAMDIDLANASRGKIDPVGDELRKFVAATETQGTTLAQKMTFARKDGVLSAGQTIAQNGYASQVADRTEATMSGLRQDRETQGMSQGQREQHDTLKATLEDLTGQKGTLAELEGYAKQLQGDMFGSYKNADAFAQAVTKAKIEMAHPPGFQAWVDGLKPLQDRLQDIKKGFAEDLSQTLTDALLGKKVNWRDMFTHAREGMMKANVDQMLGGTITAGNKAINSLADDKGPLGTVARLFGAHKGKPGDDVMNAVPKTPQEAQMQAGQVLKMAGASLMDAATALTDAASTMTGGGGGSAPARSAIGQIGSKIATAATSTLSGGANASTVSTLLSAAVDNLVTPGSAGASAGREGGTHNYASLMDAVGNTASGMMGISTTPRSIDTSASNGSLSGIGASPFGDTSNISPVVAPNIPTGGNNMLANVLGMAGNAVNGVAGPLLNYGLGAAMDALTKKRNRPPAPPVHGIIGQSAQAGMLKARTKAGHSNPIGDILTMVADQAIGGMGKGGLSGLSTKTMNINTLGSSDNPLSMAPDAFGDTSNIMPVDMPDLSMLGSFRYGGISTSPQEMISVRDLPHYSNGGVTSDGGMLSVLHPEEAVVPLPNGKSIPVDMGGSSGHSFTTNITVVAPDPNSFRQASSSISRAQDQSQKRAAARNLTGGG